jgi:membrane-associated protease RseP (regulator of RpoE activity)
VTRGGRAQQAGLVNNDVIVSVNGKRTDSTPRLWGILAALGAGDPVELSIYRSGQLKFISLPTASGTVAVGFPIENWRWGAGGAQAAGPTGQMGGQGLGPSGVLSCPNCRTKVVQQQVVARNTVPCPTCGTRMVRTQ